MTVNVHTYYRNRLAFEQAVEHARREAARAEARPPLPVSVAPPRRAVVFPAMVLYGLLVGLAYASWICYCLRFDHPPIGQLLAAGLLWGAVWGIALHVGRGRFEAFLDTLLSPVPARHVLAPEFSDPDEKLDLTWMEQGSRKVEPAARKPSPWSPTAVEPAPARSNLASHSTTGLRNHKGGSVSSMIDQLSESLTTTPEPPRSLPARGRVWGGEVEMSRPATR